MSFFFSFRNGEFECNNLAQIDKVNHTIGTIMKMGHKIMQFFTFDKKTPDFIHTDWVMVCKE